MWNINIQQGWQPISFDVVTKIKLGDTVAPKPPQHKNSLVYTVNSIEFDGSFDLVSKPVSFSYSIGNLITGTIIKPEKLVADNWWHFDGK